MSGAQHAQKHLLFVPAKHIAQRAHHGVNPGWWAIHLKAPLYSPSKAQAADSRQVDDLGLDFSKQGKRAINEWSHCMLVLNMPRNICCLSQLQLLHKAHHGVNAGWCTIHPAGSIVFYQQRTGRSLMTM